MKIIKSTIFTIAISIVAYFQVQTSPNTDVISLYTGVVFHGNVGFYVRYFFLFACYSLYLYNEFETYLNEYGIILVTRQRSRDQLFLQLTKKLLWFVLQVEGMRIVFYLLFMIFLKGSITMQTPVELFCIFFLYLLGLFIIMFVQMMIEIYFSGNIAVAICLSYFLLSIGISDLVGRIHFFSNKIRFLFLPNYMMKVRFDTLFSEEKMYYVIIAVFAIISIVLFICGKRLFRKKDIL